MLHENVHSSLSYALFLFFSRKMVLKISDDKTACIYYVNQHLDINFGTIQGSLELSV